MKLLATPPSNQPAHGTGWAGGMAASSRRLRKMLQCAGGKYWNNKDVFQRPISLAMESNQKPAEVGGAGNIVLEFGPPLDATARTERNTMTAVKRLRRGLNGPLR